MGLRSLVSFGLLVLPVAITAGALLGIDAYRSSTGQEPLYVDNAISTNTYCQKSYGISPPSDGQQYILNPNQWGIIAGQPGGLCMNITSFNNGSYVTNTTGPEFSITWQYPKGTPTNPVHAFPNIQIDSDSTLPVQMSSVLSIDVNVTWNYGLGNGLPTTTNILALTSEGNMMADVAFDMYLDPVSSASQDTTKAAYEVMVWLAQIGVDTYPIGWQAGIVTNTTVNGVVFSLFTGKNSNGQTVLTWVASKPVTEFIQDISPFVTQLATYGGPTSSDYLGYVAFGSETLSSSTNVTLSVPSLSMSVQSG